MDVPTSELLDLLQSPDPHQRDVIAYSQLAERITNGAEDDRLHLVGDRLVSYFDHERIYARSFAALVLAEVVTRDALAGLLEPQTIRTWLAAFSDRYLGEEDLRGFDADLGWLHAVAHGADAIGAFARHRHLQRDELSGLLDLARDRLLSSGSTLFANQEDDRVALAMMLVLSRTRPFAGPQEETEAMTGCWTTCPET